MAALYYRAKSVYVLDVNLGALIDSILTLAKDRRALGDCKAVAVFAQFTGGWYVFDVPGFQSRCATFSKLEAARRTEDSIQTIFDIHEYTRVPVLAPGESPSPEDRQQAVVVKDGNLVGVWLKNERVRESLSPGRGIWKKSLFGKLKDTLSRSLMPKYEVRESRPLRREVLIERVVISDGAEIRTELEAIIAVTTDEPFRRTPHLDAGVATCPPPGEQFDVEIYCDTGPPREGETSQELLIQIPARQQEVSIEVFFAPGVGLRIIGPMSQTLLLRRSEAESGRVKFRVAVEADVGAGGASLNAYFFYNGRPCGSVMRVLQTTDGTPPPNTTGRLVVDMDAKPADLTVSVTRQSGSVACYRVKVSSPHLSQAEIGYPADWDLGTPAQDYVTTLFANFVARREDPTNRLAALRGAGQNLFEKTPKNFQEAYERLTKDGKLKTILIVSDEPYIPWELMVPPATPEQSSQGVQRDPIGVAQAVGRWVSDEHLSPVAKLKVERMMVVAPDYTGTELKVLAQSKDEADYLNRRFGAKVLAPTVYATILAALEDQPPDLFHFVGHGNSSTQAPEQCLHLESKDSLTPDVVRGERAFTMAFAQRRPVVFLNACEVGQQVLALGGPAGFVPTFLKMYASSVIAPLWSVRDSVAHEVAQSLYNVTIPETGSPIPFAEALRQIRERCYRGTNTGEDTYAAYCFYGDPNFVIENTCPATLSTPSPAQP